MLIVLTSMQINYNKKAVRDIGFLNFLIQNVNIEGNETPLAFPVPFCRFT